MYTEDGESVSCEVEATVTEPITVTSLTISGTPDTSLQQLRQLPDLTGLTFTYGLSNGESIVKTTDQMYDTTTQLDLSLATGENLDNCEWTSLNFPTTVTFTVADDNNDEGFSYWTQHMGYSVASPAPSAQIVFEAAATLDSLSVSGSFTNTQYAGSAPDLTGLTFTATYDDQSTTTVSASDIVCTPSVWDASGNPNNLGTQNVVFTYTEDGNSVSTGINGTVIHRPDDQTLSASTGGYVYYDLTQSMFDDWVAGPMDILTGEKNPTMGDYINLVFTQDEMDDPTETVTAAKLGGWAQDVNIQGDQSQGIDPGDPNFVPGFGVFKNNSLSDSYVGVSLQGGATIADTINIYTVFGTLKSTAIDPSVGYCLADLETSGRTIYITRVTV